MKLKIISLVLLILFSLACSGSQSDGGTDVGTIVTNPSSPSIPKVTTDLNLAPDFSQVPMEAFWTEVTSESFSLILENEASRKDNMVIEFLDFFFRSAVTTIFDKWEEEKLLFEAISDILLQENIIIDNTLKTVTLPTPYSIWGATTQKIEVRLDSVDLEYILIDGYNINADLPLWHYRVKLDSNNQAIKGWITFVNTEGTLSAVELIFDLSNPNQSLVALRVNKKHPDSNFYEIQMQQQCSFSECVVENVTTKEEKINPWTHFRFSYNGTEVCLGAFGRDPLSVDIVRTFGIEIGEAEVTQDICTITLPVWDGHQFTVEGLLDLETAFNHLEGDSITPTLIDSCLAEAECE